MKRSESSRVELGPWTVLPSSRRLRRDGADVAIGGRAFDLLLCLIRGADRVIGRAELMDAVWPGTAVIENNLNAQVASLRKVLGADAVVNVPGRGYQLGLAVTGGEGATPELPSIAVLPFDNLSTDLEQAHLADGIAQDIITALSCFQQIVVIARNSSFAFKGRSVDVRELGRLLDARYVLEGSVQRAAGRLRVTAQLVETTKGTHLWAAHFDGDFASVFDFQDDIAARVVSAIEPALRKVEIEQARRKRPENLASYDLFMRALPHVYAFRAEDNDRALALLEQALALDPRFAAARAHAAWCYEQRLNRRWPNADERQRPVAVALAREALAEGGDASVIGLAGFVLVMLGGDVANGLAALRRATTLNPNHAAVCSFAGTANLFEGDLSEALRHLERARRFSASDATAFMVLSALACAFLMLGEHEEALAVCTESAALHADMDFTWWIAASTAGHSGNTDAARAAFENLRRLSPGSPLSFPAFKRFGDPTRREIMLAGLRKAWPSASEFDGSSHKNS